MICCTIKVMYAECNPFVGCNPFAAEHMLMSYGALSQQLHTGA